MADISTGRQRGIVPFVDETTGRLPDQYLPQGVIDLQGDLEQAVTSASASATAAKASAESATQSASAAKASETNAASSVAAAKASETNAASSVAAAKVSETNAASSVAAAKVSETNAADSATNAQQAVDGFGLEVGTTTTGESGTDASVNITKQGTKYVADFTIPTGAQGPKGDPGDLTTVAHDSTLTGNGTSGTPLGVSDTIARKSELEQKINSFKAAVSETYTTKTDFTNLNNAATKTYQFHDNVDQTGWYKLGTWSNTNQADVCAITIYAGSGQNGRADQNREVRVFIKDAFQYPASASGAFAVTIDRIRNADNAEVQVRATAADSCDVWYKGDTRYAAGRYTISIDPGSKWTHSGSFTTSAPSSGTLQTQEYQTYTTKAEVEQTLLNYVPLSTYQALEARVRALEAKLANK